MQFNRGDIVVVVDERSTGPRLGAVLMVVEGGFPCALADGLWLYVMFPWRLRLLQRAPL